MTSTTLLCCDEQFIRAGPFPFRKPLCLEPLQAWHSRNIGSCSTGKQFGPVSPFVHYIFFELATDVVDFRFVKLPP